jgi:hypothetical protein
MIDTERSFFDAEERLPEAWISGSDLKRIQK